MGIRIYIVFSLIIVFQTCFYLIQSADEVLDHDRRVVCYMASWGIFLAGSGKFDTVDGSQAAGLCTHMVYAFVGLDGLTFNIRSTNPNRDLPDNFGQAGIAKTVAFRKKHPHLKVMVAIGGWNDGSVNYSNMVSIKTNRNTFITSVVQFLKTHKLDGLELNWQFPGDRGGSPADKTNYVFLVKEMREEFDKHGFILSLALSCFPWRISLGVDAGQLSKYAHFINILAYEYHGFWEQKAGIGAPLHADDGLSLEATLELYINQGAPPDKINLGLSAYGMTFILKENAGNDTNVIGRPALSDGFKGPFNDVNGFIAYNEVCTLMKDGGWQTAWHEQSMTPYAVKGDRVMSYENEESYKAKVKWAMENKLGGVLFYGLEKDDFRGDCGSTKYPLLKSINKALTEFSSSIYNDLLELLEQHTADWFWSGMGNKV